MSTTGQIGRGLAHSQLVNDVERGVADANVPTLLMVLAHMTGDKKWLRAPFTPTRIRGMSTHDDGGLPPHVQAHVRRAAVDALVDWVDAGRSDVPLPSDDELVEMLSVGMGEEVPRDYGLLVAAELQEVLGLPSGQRGPRLQDVPPGFSVAIVGAGVSGICAATSLKEAGIPAVIFDKAQRVGGVWVDNVYPGAGVDTPSHIYSYSFAPYDWSRHFADQGEVREYLEHVVDEIGLRDEIRLGHNVVAARYDEGAGRWQLEVEHMVDGELVRSTHEATILISAVGLFNPPITPHLEGMETFRGAAFHTAQWPEGLELAGKRVGVLGTGASAMQVVPAIADVVDELFVFQRSPQWAAPNEKFQVAISEPLRQLMRDFPMYRAWYRVRVAWIYNDRLYDSLRKDPEWHAPERSLNAVNDRHREFFTSYIKSELGDRTDLLDKVVPTYPPFGKRILMDNGWFRTLTKPNVHLVTESVKRVVPSGLVTADGQEYDIDILVLATGFDVLKYVSTMDVAGRDGVTLRDVWGDDDARAYLGGTVPKFPNFFVLYGPHAQPGHGGSYMALVESQVNYVLDVIRQMVDQRLKSVDVRPEVWKEYNERIDEENGQMVWTHPGMATYYRNRAGRVVVNLPFTNVYFWQRTRHADLAEFEVQR